ncbi:unnamed protein product [Lathyrus sativus]|nr:unnamed protein product [Lathyrus sativus]
MPDNDTHRQVEDQIKRLAKYPQVFHALVLHLRIAKTPNVCQFVVVLLRKKITSHWSKLSPQDKQLVKDSLIQSITLGHNPPVWKVSVNVVSIVAKYVVLSDEWSELFSFLFHSSQSPQEDQRE